MHETLLISRGINKRESGQYDWYECEWLMIHEAFRRELLRAERSLSNIDVVKHKWHIVNLYQWMNYYLLPCLFNQLKTTVEIIIPYYKSKGEESIDVQKAQVVLLLMNGIEEKVNELYCSVYQPININQALTSQDLIEKTTEIKRLFSIFKTYLFVYMDEQDKLWSAVYNEYGIESLSELTESIYKEGNGVYKTSQDKRLFKLFLASMLDAGGYQQQKYTPMTSSILQRPTFPVKVNVNNYEMQNFLPWCNQEFIHQIYNNLSFYTRMIEMPGIIKEYHCKWKVMIESISNDYDCLKLL